MSGKRTGDPLWLKDGPTLREKRDSGPSCIFVQSSIFHDYIAVGNLWTLQRVAFSNVTKNSVCVCAGDCVGTYEHIRMSSARVYAVLRSVMVR